MQNVFDAIDETAELSLASYNLKVDGQHCFFIEEQSALQILRELPAKTKLVVEEVFSQRHRVAKKIEVILASKSVGELLAQTLPLVEEGCFPCDVLRIAVDTNIIVVSRNDYSVELRSHDLSGLKQLLAKIFWRQNYSVDLLDEIIRRPNLYHQLEPPNIIRLSNPEYEE